MKKLTLVCALIMLVIPAIGMAQIQNSLGIGPRLGYYKANDADEGNFYGGVQVRAHLGRVLGVEGSVDYRTGAKYDLGEFSSNVRQVPVQASLLLFLPISDYISPYGIAGFGAYYNIIDYDSDAEALGFDDEHSVDFGYHLGFGVELPITQKVALDADYRYIYLDPGSDTFGDTGDAKFSGNQFTAGLTFYL